jgi:hypothetical protein
VSGVQPDPAGATAATDPVPRRPDRRRSCALRPDRQAPRTARAFVVAACAAWGVRDVAEDAQLAVTELVTDAVERHRGVGLLTVGLEERGLRIAVRDFPDLAEEDGPRVRVPGGAARVGTALHVLASLTPHWGVTGHPDGKTVWLVLPAARAPDRSTSSNP